MAGDWIKVDNVTPDKPEVFAIAEHLEIDPDAALGKVIRLWVWADQQTYDGNAQSVTRSLLDRVAGAPGFADALESVGWLAQGEGGYVFPNFERHNGQTAKRRALTLRRVRGYRSQNGAYCNAAGVTKALPETETEYKSSSYWGKLRSVDVEEARRQANEILPRIYRNPTAIKDGTRDTIWAFACFATADLITEADSASILEATVAPGVKCRATYLRGCLRKKLDSRGLNYDAALSEMPPRPTPKDA